MSLTPDVFEAIGRELGIANRVLDILVPEISLNGAGIDAFFSQSEPARVPEHMGMDFEGKASRGTSPFNDPGKSPCGEGAPALRCEDECRFRFLLTGQPSQSPQLVPIDGMGGRRTFLDPSDGQHGAVKINLVPSQAHQFAGSQAVLVGHQEHGAIAVPPTIGSNRFHQPLDLGIRQILPGP